jgi:hypothetical protein
VSGNDGKDRGNQYTGRKRQTDNVSLPKKYGNSAEYIMRRLASNRPAIAHKWPVVGSQ